MIMQVSRRLAAVQSPIIPTVAEWTRNRPGTLSLGQGMVFYPPPESVAQAIDQFGRRPEQHLYGPAFGYRPLLDLITEKLKRENQIDCAQTAYQIIVTAGSNMAFLHALLAISDPGDEIILPSPYYFNQEMAVRMLNCTPVAVPTDDQFQLQVAALERAITAKTRAIVTISPNNPSGAVYSEATLRAVSALCQKYGLYHISDEAYEYFIYDGAKHFSPASIDGSEAYTISLFSLSKAYGFASWRVGYSVAPEHLLPALLKIQDTNLICPPLISQYAAVGALQAGSAYCRMHLPQLAAVRRMILSQFTALSGLCDLAVTKGAFYFLLKLKTEKNDLQLVKSLIDQFAVAAIPGCAFGLTEDCYLRISYGMLDETSADLALSRLANGLQALCG
jgi:aspartate/methionine/tyrosine aminotransferase